jgi:hypothetical protein
MITQIFKLLTINWGEAKWRTIQAELTLELKLVRNIETSLSLF